jgi:hypothetical protein
MLRYIAIGLAAVVAALSISCSSTNVTGIAVPTRTAADVPQDPSTGNDVMSVPQDPSTGNDVMTVKVPVKP